MTLGPDLVVPPTPAEQFDPNELEGALGMLRSRMLAGQRKYAGSFCEVDLKQDMVEELLDVAAYALLMLFRIRRSLPGFIGPSSNQWAERP